MNRLLHRSWSFGVGGMSASLLVLATWAAAADAALLVDFNFTPPTSLTQPGWNSVTQTGASGIVSDVGTIDISLNAATDDRDRGAITGVNAGLSNLARDFVFTAANQSPSQSQLDVRIAGLLAGQYELTGYFHDATADQGTTDVFISVDGGSNFSLMLDNQDVTFGSSPASIGTGVFSFSADGINDVVLRVRGNADGALSVPVHLINGFAISTIPEPASIVTWLCGAIALVVLGKRLRRKVSR